MDNSNLFDSLKEVVSKKEEEEEESLCKEYN
jgi:hypothetical protein